MIRSSSSSRAGDPRASKRVRIDGPEVDDGEFKRGAIRKVTLHNFVTYSDVVFTPGPGLNLIVGPNGSGKSSIICALCLGLGGSTSSLGRADKVGDFVKRGEQSGYIQIDLYDPSAPGGRNVIRRLISKDSKSSWNVNKKKSSLKEVQSLVQAYSIQVDNLCQFLAQEKVSHFAGLNPVELLKQTEIAASDSTLRSQHEELVVLGKELAELQTSLSGIDAAIESLAAQETSLGREVARLKARDILTTKIDLLKKKRPWVRFQALKLEARNLKEKEAVAKAKLDELQAGHQPLEEQIKNLKLELKAVEAHGKKQKEIFRRGEQTVKRLRDELDTDENDVTDLNASLFGVDERAEKTRKEIATTHRKIEILKEQIENLPDKAEIHEQLRQLTSEASQNRAEGSRIANDISTVETELNEVKRRKDARTGELKEMRDVTKRREQALLGGKGAGAWRGTNVSKFREWIHKEGQAKCHSRVYGPLALELNVTEKGTEAFIEAAVSYSLKMAFVVDNAHDLVLLSEKRNELSLRGITIINSERAIVRERNIRLPPNLSWLDEAVEAPDSVMKVLKSQCLRDHAYSLMDFPNGPDGLMPLQQNEAKPRSIYTPSKHYSVSFSRYARGKSVGTVVGVSRAQIYTGNVDNDAIKRVQEEIQDIESQSKELLTNKQTLQAEKSRVAKTRKVITEKQSKLNSVGKTRTSCTRKLESLSKTVTLLEAQDDCEEEKRLLNEQISNLNKSRVQHVKQLGAAVRDWARASVSRDALSMSKIHYAELLRVSENDLKEKSLAHTTAKDVHALAYHNLKEGAKSAKVARQIAERNAPLDEFREKFAEAASWLPGTVEEIDDMVNELNTRVDAFVGDDSVQRRFDDVCKELRRKRTLKETQGEQLEEKTGLANELKNTWKDGLEKVVGEINKDFSKFFKDIGCRGQVHLRENEDYEKWGLAITVSYRADVDMQCLDQSRQSGGERSVATMLFLLALQKVTESPMRVVDEINQGMDATNERAVFNQIVECSSGRNLPQYFVVTPKMLPNLNIAPSVTTFVVMNGPWNLPQSDFDLWKVVESREAMRAS